jgi:hypothetical protein
MTRLPLQGRAMPLDDAILCGIIVCLGTALGILAVLDWNSLYRAFMGRY